MNFARMNDYLIEIKYYFIDEQMALRFAEGGWVLPLTVNRLLHGRCS